MLTFDPTLRFKNPSSQFPMVVAMYTADHLSYAERLAESLKRLRLSYSICEIDSIHSSTSLKGSEGSKNTKPTFIKDWLEKTKKPVLYVDADTVFRSIPTKIFYGYKNGSHFAVFSWLSGEDNQTYFPSQSTSDGASQRTKGGYVEGFSIKQRSDDQIIVSGAVQFWGNSKYNFELLEIWHSTILENPKSRDDHSLDYSFNNFIGRKNLNLFPLPRAYCRYAWWPWVEPVIDHPDFPAVNMPWEPLSEKYLPKRLDKTKILSE